MLEGIRLRHVYLLLSGEGTASHMSLRGRLASVARDLKTKREQDIVNQRLI